MISITSKLIKKIYRVNVSIFNKINIVNSVEDIRAIDESIHKRIINN